MSTTTLAARRDRAMGAGAPLFYDKPLHIVRGEGTYLFDDTGRRYVDMYNNVPCVGHANPHVVEAMARQQATLNVHSRYLHEGIVVLAERIAALAWSGDRERRLQLLGHRGQRGRPAHRARRDRQAGHHLHQHHLSRQQRGGRQDDPHRRRPEHRRRCTRHPLPLKIFRPLVPGASEADLREAYLEQPAQHDPQPRGRRHGLRGPDRLPDLRQRGPARRAARQLWRARRRSCGRPVAT